jgi:hypothetical protein
MSTLAAAEVARNVGAALDMLRRPENAFGREFLLAAGSDPQGDLTILANPVALSHATAANIAPPANAFSCGVGGGHNLPGPLNVVYTMVPSITVGTLTCGLCIQRVGCPIATAGRMKYSAGRFIRCEATGETLIATTALVSGAAAAAEPGALVYLRHDSSTARFHLFATIVPGVPVRAVYADYLRGDPRALAAHFLFAEAVTQVRQTGCPECQRPAEDACNCDLRHVVPRSALDFSVFEGNHNHHLGLFAGKSVLSIITSRSAEGEDAGGEAVVGAERRPAFPAFTRIACPPQFIDCKPLDSGITDLLARLAIQDRLQTASPAKLIMPSGDGAVPSTLALLEDAIGEPGTGVVHALYVSGVASRVLDPCGSQLTVQESLPSVGDETMGMSGKDGDGVGIFDSFAEAAGAGGGKLAPFVDADTIMSGLDDISTVKDIHPDAGFELFLDDHVPLEHNASFSGNAEWTHNANKESTISPPESSPSPSDGSAGAQDPSEATKRDGAPVKVDHRKLTRQAKNRLAAARSNARRKHEMDSLKHSVAEAREMVRSLKAREAELRDLNRQLKEDAALRWVRAASSGGQRPPAQSS